MLCKNIASIYGEVYVISACFVRWRTLYDLLRVVGEELAEWGSLGPLQGVEQLLDLGRHSAADGNSWRET